MVVDTRVGAVCLWPAHDHTDATQHDTVPAPAPSRGEGAGKGKGGGRERARNRKTNTQPKHTRVLANKGGKKQQLTTDG